MICTDKQHDKKWGFVPIFFSYVDIIYTNDFAFVFGKQKHILHKQYRKVRILYYISWTPLSILSI